MFYLLECFSCGCPIGEFAYRYELAKIINFSQRSPEIIQLLEAIIKKYHKYADELVDFILESLEHFDTFEGLQVETAISRLITQYNTIYPYPEKRLEGELKSIIESSTEIEKVFQLLREDYSRGKCEKEIIENEDPQDKNTVYEFLKDNNISRLCCRNSILTFVDFYHTKNAL